MEEIPPPMPCSKRHRFRATMFGEKQHPNPPPINRMRPQRVRVRRPCLSDNRPPNNEEMAIIKAYDKMVNCSHDGVELKCTVISGNEGRWASTAKGPSTSMHANRQTKVQYFTPIVVSRSRSDSRVSLDGMIRVDILKGVHTFLIELLFNGF